MQRRASTNSETATIPPKWAGLSPLTQFGTMEVKWNLYGAYFVPGGMDPSGQVPGIVVGLPILGSGGFEFDRPIGDVPIDSRTYNCGAFAFREYGYPNLKEIKIKLKGCKRIDCSKQCFCGQLKCYFWEIKFAIMGRPRSPSTPVLILKNTIIILFSGKQLALMQR